MVFGVVPNLSGIERVFNKGEIQRKDSPNAELPRDLGGNDGLGPPTPLNAPSIPRNDKLGLPHPAHRKVDLIRGWTTRCVLDILDAVIQRRIYRPTIGRSRSTLDAQKRSEGNVRYKHYRHHRATRQASTSSQRAHRALYPVGGDTGER